MIFMAREEFGGRAENTSDRQHGAKLEPPARLERATRALGEPCSIHLSYGGRSNHTRLI